MFYFTHWTNLLYIYFLYNKNTKFYNIILLIHLHVSIISFYFTYIYPKYVYVPGLKIKCKFPFLNIIDIIFHHYPTYILLTNINYNYNYPCEFSFIFFFIYLYYLKLISNNVVKIYKLPIKLHLFSYLISLIYVKYII